MYKLQDTLPVEMDGKLVFKFSRPELEVLVKEAKKLERNYGIRKMMKRHFYVYDFEVVGKLQRRNNFLLYDLGEYNKDNRVMTFMGKEFDDTNALNGRNVSLIVRDLEHTTSKRFGYAIHESIIRNYIRYSQHFEGRNLTYSNQEIAETFFNDALIDYLRTNGQ